MPRVWGGTRGGDGVRRVGRIILNAVIILSALLCLATAVLWVRSYWRFVDFARIQTRRDAVAYTQNLARLGSSEGVVIFTWRDVIWPWSDPGTAKVSVDWEHTKGA